MMAAACKFTIRSHGCASRENPVDRTGLSRQRRAGRQQVRVTLGTEGAAFDVVGKCQLGWHRGTICTCISHADYSEIVLTD